MAKPKNQSTLPVEIVIEAKTASAVANLEKLAQQTKKTEAETAKLAAQTKKLEADTTKLGAAANTVVAPMNKTATAAKAVTAATDKTGVSAGKGASVLTKLAGAAKSSGVGFNLLTTGVQGTLAAFGPWGIAASIVTGALANMISGQNEAAEAARKHTKELLAQARAQHEAFNAQFRHSAGGLKIEQARKRFFKDSGLSTLEEELAAAEEGAATAKGLGASPEGFLREQARLRGEILDLRAKSLEIGHKEETLDEVRARHAENDRVRAEAEAVRREERMRQLEDGEDKHHKKKKERSAEEIAWLNEIAMLRNGKFMGRESSDSRAFAEELGNVKDSRLQRPGVKLIDPFSTEEELDRIAKESDARIKATEDAKDAAAERSKKRHEEEVKRQNELIERQEKAGKVAGDTVSGLATAWLAAGDLSAKGFKKALAEWGKAESIRLAGVAISEGIQALVSIAFFNYPQAALHGAAAAAAGAGAALIAGMTAATGGFGSLTKSPSGKNPGGAGFNSGDSFGGGSGSGGPQGAPGSSNSQKDQLPTTGDGMQHAQAGGGAANSGGTHYYFSAGSIQTLGAIDEKTGLTLAQGIRKAERSLGKTGT